jgi:hypothetical protein
MGIAAIAALLVPFIPSAINLVEGLIKKPSSGQDKADLVLQFLRQTLVKLQSQGVIPAGTSVTDDALMGLIESIFQQMTVNGQVNGNAPVNGAPAPAAPSTIPGMISVLLPANWVVRG